MELCSFKNKKTMMRKEKMNEKYEKKYIKEFNNTISSLIENIKEIIESANGDLEKIKNTELQSCYSLYFKIYAKITAVLQAVNLFFENFTQLVRYIGKKESGIKIFSPIPFKNPPLLFPVIFPPESFRSFPSLFKDKEEKKKTLSKEKKEDKEEYIS